MDGIRHGGDQIAKELDHRHLVRSRVQLHIGELGRPVDGNEEAQLTLGSLHLGDIDVEITDRVGLELLLGRLAGTHLRQLRNAVALKASMQ